MNSKRFALHVGILAVMLVIVSFLVVANVRAQDVTDEPTADPTVVVTPVDEVPADPDVPVVVVDGSMNWALVGLFIGAIVGLGGIAIYAISAAAKGVPVEQIDADTTRRVQDYQRDREVMEALEKAHEKASAAYKVALDTTLGVLNLVSPFLTRFTTDDSLRDLIKDIQTPGAPETTVTAGNASAVPEPPAQG